MRRWHQDVALMKTRNKNAPEWMRGNGQLGRWRKRKPYDCGRTKCGCCHGDKFFGPKARETKKREAIRFASE